MIVVVVVVVVVANKTNKRFRLETWRELIELFFPAVFVLLLRPLPPPRNPCSPHSKTYVP